MPTTQCCHGNKTQSDKHYSYWETAPRAYPLSLFKDLLLHVRAHTSLVPRPSSARMSERVWRSERLFLSLLPDLRARIRLQTHNYMRGCRQLSTRFSTHGVHRNAMITFFISFSPAPCDKKSRSEYQTLIPLFREGSGDETSYIQGALEIRPFSTC